MNSKKALKAAELTEGISIAVADAELLTPKEFEQESKALLEEAQKRSWLSQSPRQLAARIPVSVFAMGEL
jgi:hypothetical protein